MHLKAYDCLTLAFNPVSRTTSWMLEIEQKALEHATERREETHHGSHRGQEHGSTYCR